METTIITITIIFPSIHHEQGTSLHMMQLPNITVLLDEFHHLTILIYAIELRNQIITWQFKHLCDSFHGANIG